ncbi:hypothetical protein CIL02_03360 [Prevotella sp. P3-122]|nr:hypothetical protein CIL02_03360 [Prevotella sp. P3-122]
MVMRDLTFIIPIRVDTVNRLENIIAIIKFLCSIKAFIIVVESNTIQNNILRRLLPRNDRIQYMFIEDDDVVFHRTKIINIALGVVNTEFVSVWDADVLVDKIQIAESMNVLREGKADLSFPYNGIFLNTDIIIRNLYLVNHNIKKLHRFKNYMSQLYDDNFVGGAFIINMEKYRLSGFENENFYGWGPEDLDRVLRWQNLGYIIHRSQGPMYHLCHPRDINGCMRSEIQNKLCNQQLAYSQYL